MKQKRGSRGFTMVELIVVVGIIGMLAAMALIGLGRQQARARDVRRKADITNINTALQGYIAENLEPKTTSENKSVDCGTWDYSSENGCGTADPNGDYWVTFLKPFMGGTIPHDPINDGAGDVCLGGTGYAYGYFYYKDKVDDNGYNYYVLKAKLEQNNQCTWTQIPVRPK